MGLVCDLERPCRSTLTLGKLPSESTEKTRRDDNLKCHLAELFGTVPLCEEPLQLRTFSSVGCHQYP